MSRILFLIIFFCIVSISNNLYAQDYAPLELNKQLQFPKDHGSHLENRFEWWYFTGHLHTKENRAFGFELTFFRIGINPFPAKPPSPWDINSIYVTHFALTNDHDNKFFYIERLNRDSFGMAGSEPGNLHVWNGDWYARYHDNVISIYANASDYALSLNLTPTKPLLLQGDKGYSKKYKGIYDASYYYSFPLLEGSGKIIFKGKEYIIDRASAWMDHEFSTTIYAVKMAWEWFAIQLNNGDQIMVTKLIFENDKSDNSHDFGVIYKKNGEIIKLKPNDFKIKPLSKWRSPRTNITYPSRWLVTIPKYQYQLTIKPTVKNQEFISSMPTYWEGRATVTGKENNLEVNGNAYIELHPAQ